jgi:hypothetical protein
MPILTSAQLGISPSARVPGRQRSQSEEAMCLAADSPNINDLEENHVNI